jgi:hypothetical protein
MQYRFPASGAIVVACSIVASALMFLPAAGEDEAAPPKPDETAAPAPDDEPAVITNEVLERMFGPGDPSAPKPEGEPHEDAAHEHGEVPAPPPVLPDPLQAMEQKKSDEARRQQAIADTQREIDAAEATVRDLEKRLLEQRNPYLPRPALSKEESEAQAGLNGAERVARTQEQLDLARKELERAKAQLDRLRSGT